MNWRQGDVLERPPAESRLWGVVPLDAVVLSLSLLATLVRPPDAKAIIIAMAATFLLGLYWIVALLGRNGAGESGGRAFRAQLTIVLALIGLLVVLLSPFFAPTLVYGQDDVLVLALLLLFGRALYHGQHRQAALWLDLACRGNAVQPWLRAPFPALPENEVALPRCAYTERYRSFWSLHPVQVDAARPESTSGVSPRSRSATETHRRVQD